MANKKATTKTEAQEPVSVIKDTEDIVRKTIPSVVFVRKINKLAKFSKFGAPKFFGQERYKPDSDSGSDIPLTYRGNTIPGSRRNLTPQWDSLDRRWAWKGTFEDLIRIAKILRLRGPDQEVILPDKYSFTNAADKFFSHSFLWNNQEMQIVEGGVTLKTDVPLDEFYARTYLGNPGIQDSTKTQSKAMLAGAELEVWSPKAEVRAKTAGYKLEDKAIGLLTILTPDKQRLIAQIIRPSGFDSKKDDAELVYAVLRESAALNTSTSSKFGGLTYQARFIELAETPDEELYIIARIIDSKYKGAIIKKKGTYHFLTKPLHNEDGTNVVDDLDLVNFFRRFENDSYFQELSEWLDSNI